MLPAQQTPHTTKHREQRRVMQLKAMRNQSTPMYTSVWLALLNGIRQQQIKHP